MSPSVRSTSAIIRVFLGITLIALSVMLVARWLFAPEPEGELLKDPVLNELRMSKALDREAERAMELAHEGQHVEAAVLLAQVAAAEKLLLKNLLQRTEPSEPTGTELAALMQFRVARNDGPYREFLKLLYPSWDPAAGRSLPHEGGNGDPGL